MNYMMGPVPGMAIQLVNIEDGKGNQYFHLTLCPLVVLKFLIWSTCEKVILYQQSLEYVKRMSFALSFFTLDSFIYLATIYWLATLY